MDGVRSSVGLAVAAGVLVLAACPADPPQLPEPSATATTSTGGEADDTTTGPPPGSDSGSDATTDVGGDTSGGPAGPCDGAPDVCHQLGDAVQVEGEIVAIALGDLDADGLDDLGAAIDGAIVTALGHPISPLATPLYGPPGPNAAADIALGDLDGDGRADVAVGGASTLALWHSLGEGALQLRDTAGVMSGIVAVGIDPQGAQGQPEIVTVGGQIVRWRVGDGDMLDPLSNVTLADGPVAAAAVTLAELHPSAGLEVVLGDDAQSQVSVWARQGDPFAAVGMPLAVVGPSAVARIEGTGVLGGFDAIAVGSSEANVVGIATVGPRGDLVLGTLAPVAATPDVIAVADLDLDGTVDLVVGTASLDFDGGTVYVRPGDGEGSFLPAVEFDVGADVVDLAIGDVNADAIPDIIAATKSYYVPILSAPAAG